MSKILRGSSIDPSSRTPTGTGSGLVAIRASMRVSVVQAGRLVTVVPVAAKPAAASLPSSLRTTPFSMR